ncbi:MAG: undecaprenyl/decaprenyl-phosphate alpha-N-acetylglucosaminyl 1-phosphate transferase [Bacilli bacterium]|nr:undecaprenyl/decaprenyl-phosphate alpha-N-acetylglucosaminyl 1-phosphate transferase [Bacilli bacterium]
MREDMLLNTILMIVVPFVFVAGIIPYMKKLAFQIGAIDKPRARHIHKVPMPKLGGVAIFLGFLLGYMIFGTHSSQMNAVLIGSFFIILTGVVDDISELKPLTKFIGQFAAACVVVFYGNIIMQDLSAFGIYIKFGVLSYPITVIFILGCINCINLIDGLDGLSGGISSIYYLTIGIIAFIQQKFGLDYVLTMVMLGSTLGFLVHNFYPAKIFAGDSGSMFMGFTIAVIALFGFKNVTLSSLIIPLLLIAIPILDTLFAIIRRTLKGESPTKADKFHIHHQLLNRNLSHRTTVLIIYLIDALFAFASIIYVIKDNMLGYIIYGILLIIVIIFVATTNVVFEHEGLKEIIKRFKKNKD